MHLVLCWDSQDQWLPPDSRAFINAGSKARCHVEAPEAFLPTRANSREYLREISVEEVVMAISCH